MARLASQRRASAGSLKPAPRNFGGLLIFNFFGRENNL
jgi:hypothetical protein